MLALLVLQIFIGAGRAIVEEAVAVMAKLLAGRIKKRVIRIQ